MACLRRSGIGVILWVSLACGLVFAESSIDFGGVVIGTTETVTYTFKIGETSLAPGVVTEISAPGIPFGLQNVPALPVTIQPGDSISFQVTFSPGLPLPCASFFTIAVRVGSLAHAMVHEIALSGQGVRSPVAPPVPPARTEIVSEIAELVAGNTEFAFDLYQAIRGTEGNLLYSPYSVSLALAMAYAGARDTTEEQMAEVLHFTLLQEGFHPALQTLSLVVASRSGAPEAQLNIANSLWVQTGYSFLRAFLDLLAANYGAAPRPVDFRGAPGEACDAVNEWVSRETEGKIQNLLDPAAIKPLTQLILANAIYFKADWLHPFSEAATRDGLFYLLDGSAAKVPMMEQEEDFRYTSGEGYQALELPYSGKALSMVVLIPREAAERTEPWFPQPPTPADPPPTGPIDPADFEELERLLDAEKLASIVADLRQMPMRLRMPKFAYRCNLELRGVLGGMGMTDAFIPFVADFSGMDGTRELWIGDVVHAAVVTVDEKGTEAAAATGLIFPTGVPPEPVWVVIDCPFIFVIYDVETGAILFVGRVLDPRAR